MGNRSKELIANTAVFAISNFSSKVLAFLMLPLYTNVLTTGEYGKIDLIISGVTLLLPVITACLSESALRYGMDKDYSNEEVLTLAMSGVSAGLLFLAAAVCSAIWIGLLEPICIFVVLISIPNYYYSLFSMFSRGVEKVKETGVAGVIASVVMVGLNLIFLLVFKKGAEGYLIAYGSSFLVAAAYLVAAGHLTKYIKPRCLTKASLGLFKKMLGYGIPLIPNRICWWINNTANRYVMNFVIGPSPVGIYSAAMKIPTILDAIQGVFNQSWQITAIGENDSSDRNCYYKNSFKVYCCLLIFAASAILVIINPLADILFGESFYEARFPACILILSSVLGGMVGFVTAIFNAYKENRFLIPATALGAFISVVGTFLSARSFGTCGAAVSNVMAYLAIWITLSSILKAKFNLMITPNNFWQAWIVLVIQVAAYTLRDIGFVLYPVEIVGLFAVAFIEKENLKSIYKTASGWSKNKLKY